MSVSPPLMPPAFCHRVAAHSASGALRDLLEHRRLSYTHEPLSEGAIFGLSGALDLRVRIAERAIPAIDLDGRAPTLELELCRHLGIDAQWDTTSDPQKGWQLLRAELDAGMPALVHADLAELDYRHDARHDARHAIVVTAMDGADDAVWVADASFPEPQRCGLRALAAARASQAWPEPARHALLSIARAPAALADPEVAVAAALRRVVRAMRHPCRPDHPHVRTGLAGADALAAAWPRLPDAAGALLGGTLGALCFRTSDGGTGGALYRSLQARFLHDAAALLGSAELGHAALVCDGLADAWRAFAAALCDDDATAAHRAAEPWVQRIRTLEHEHVEALERHLASRRAIAA
jgi:hypothetical protein